jgi:hypothetical protein
MWDVPQASGISPEQQRTLEATWIGARNTPQKVVFRSRIVLKTAEGKANRRIAEELQTSRPTVTLWRKRFAVGGPTALTEEVAGRGRKPRIAAEKVKQIVAVNLRFSQPTKNKIGVSSGTGWCSAPARSRCAAWCAIRCASRSEHSAKDLFPKG